MGKKKWQYKGGKCSECSQEDLFTEVATIQTILLYMQKNHCCYNCAVRCLENKDGDTTGKSKS